MHAGRFAGYIILPAVRELCSNSETPCLNAPFTLHFRRLPQSNLVGRPNCVCCSPCQQPGRLHARLAEPLCWNSHVCSGLFSSMRMPSGTTICLEKTVFFAASHCTFRAVPLPGPAQDPIGRNSATLLSRRVAAWAARQASAGFNLTAAALELGLRRPMHAAVPDFVKCTPREWPIGCALSASHRSPVVKSTLNLLNFLSS